MQLADQTNTNCKQFFAAFDKINVDDVPSRNTGLTVFQVEELLGPPKAISSGVGHNLYTYSVGRCSADIEFANGRTIRKTFAMMASPEPRQAQSLPPPKPAQATLVWALAAVAAISLIALVWNVWKHRASRFQDEPYEPEPEWPMEETHEPLPAEPPRLSHAAGLNPQDRAPEQQPRKRTEDPPHWYEAS